MTDDVYIGKGKLAGKGVYAARDFKKGEIVKFYQLKKLTQSEFDALPKGEQMFVHSFWDEMYLFPEPSRYTNHSADPNTYPDFQRMCDIARRSIKKDEMITVNATQEVLHELKTYVDVHEKGKKISGFERLEGGYRNAVVRYSIGDGEEKTLTLKRVQGDWKLIK